MGDRQVRRGRTWRWLRVQIVGLLSVPPQMVSHTYHAPNGTVSGSRLIVVPQTRLGLALQPPDLDAPR